MAKWRREGSSGRALGECGKPTKALLMSRDCHPLWRILKDHKTCGTMKWIRGVRRNRRPYPHFILAIYMH
eukprot:5506960-Amphidinium_carterae.1